MRIVIAAVGRLKQGPERELAAEYCKRAEKIGRAFGLRDIEIVEIRESRAADAERPGVEPAQPGQAQARLRDGHLAASTGARHAAGAALSRRHHSRGPPLSPG